MAFSLRFPLGIAMLADDEARLDRIDMEQEFVGAEVSIGDPHISGLH